MRFVTDGHDLNIGLFVLAPKFYNDYTKEIKTES